MNNHFTFFVAIGLALIASACEVAGPVAEDPGVEARRVEEFVTLTPADAESAPDGTQPALIWKIDGRNVTSDQVRQLDPGLHELIVLPVQNESVDETLEYGRTAPDRGIDVVAVAFEFEAGQELLVAAAVRRHRSYVRDGDVSEPLGEWQVSVLPYVVTTPDMQLVAIARN